MKEFASYEIKDTEEYLKKRTFPMEVVEVDGTEFNYYVLPPALNEDFPDFAFRMTGRDEETQQPIGIFGVSDSVPPAMRPYWMAYEIRAFWGKDLKTPDRLLQAEAVTLDTIPPDQRTEYITRRRKFFKNVIGYFEVEITKGQDFYNEQDIAEAEKVLELLETQDIIPPGTFAAVESKEQVAAIQLVEQIGKDILRDHPVVADMYRDIEKVDSYSAIVNILFPNTVDEHRGVLTKAVGYAVRHLIPTEEQIEITRKRKAIQLRKNQGDLTTHQSAASRIRHEKGTPVDTEAMIKARGRTPWTDEEKEIVLKIMILDPEFQIQNGQWKGRPNYELIAETLNLLYHEEERIRYPNSVASFVRDSWRKDKKK